MKIAVFSTKSYTKEFFEKVNQKHGHELKYFKTHLNEETVKVAFGFPAVCPFVNDNLNEKVLRSLHENGTKLITLRSAGFNHVDLPTAEKLDMTVARVPEYSPYAVAEHTVALILALNRRIHKAYNRVREGNFELEGLLGFDLHGRTVGIIGTGSIGSVTAKILTGFGCHVIAFDLKPDEECTRMGVRYVSMDQLLGVSDIVSLHLPLNPKTKHLINKESIEKMQDGAILINTSRGALIDTQAVIDALKDRKIGSLGLDVYEEEGDLFFEDLSEEVITDDTFARLLTFPNVLITGHQAFFTRDALEAIAETTLNNVTAFEKGEIPKENIVRSEHYIEKKR